MDGSADFDRVGVGLLTRREMLRRLGVAGTATLSLSAFLESCTSTTPQDAAGATAGVLRVGVSSIGDTVNRVISGGTERSTLVYPTLTLDGLNGSQDSYLAKRWDVSPDGLVWTFKLKEAVWSDGVPITSADVLWSYQLLMKDQLPYGPFSGGWMSLIASGVDAPDPRTFVLTLRAPLATAVLMSGYLVWVSTLPKHVYEPFAGNDGEGLKEFFPEDSLPLVSGGPFIMTRFDPKGTSILERNPTYFGEPAKADAIGLVVFSEPEAMVQALKNGDIDVIPSIDGRVASALEGEPGLTVVPIRTSSVDPVLIVNSNPKRTKNPELADPTVREAIAHAIDRDTIIEVVYGGSGTPIASPFSPVYGEWVAPDLGDPSSFDLTRANELLDEAGYPRGADGIRRDSEGQAMAYTVLMVDVDLREFEIVQANLADVGIELTPEPLDQAAFNVAKSSPDGKYLDFDFSMTELNWGVDFNTALAQFTCELYINENQSGYCYPQFEQLFLQQEKTIDEGERREMVWQLQRMVQEVRPYLAPIAVGGFSAHSASWTGFPQYPQILENWSNIAWATEPHPVGS